jgi:hypothetical protein
MILTKFRQHFLKLNAASVATRNGGSAENGGAVDSTGNNGINIVHTQQAV